MSIPWIRLVLAISLDGRITLPKGGPSTLGGKEDRRILEETLAWADAVLLGAETLRVHKNTCLIHENDLLEKRLLEGKPKQPIVIVISNRKNFNIKWPFFQQPIIRWILSKEEFIKDIELQSGFHRQLTLQQSWDQTLNLLKQEGLEKIVLLGGANLVASLLMEDKIDELKLTLTPKIVGGKYSWVPVEIINLPSKLAEANTWILKDAKKNLSTMNSY